MILNGMHHDGFGLKAQLSGRLPDRPGIVIGDAHDFKGQDGQPPAVGFDRNSLGMKRVQHFTAGPANSSAMPGKVCPKRRRDIDLC